MGLVLRIVHLDRNALWGDEACMMFLCRESPENIISALASADRPDVDVAPPAYFLALHHWMNAFGDSVRSFRGFSVLWGVLTIWASAGLGAVAFGRKTGLITAFLVAWNPFQIWYSQEGRMYSMACFFSVAAVFFFLKLLRQPGRSIWIWSYWLASLILIYIQYYGFLLIVFLTGFQLVMLDRSSAISGWQQFRKLCYLIVGWVICYLPWIPVLIRDYSQAAAPGGFPSFFHPIQTPAFLYVKLAFFGNENFIREYFWMYPIPMLVFMCGLFLSLRHIKSQETHILFLLAFGPFLLIYLTSLMGMKIYKGHPFILFQIPLLLIMIKGLTELAVRWRIPGIAIIFTAYFIVLTTLVLDGDYVKPRVHHVVDWIGSRYREHDAVAVVPAFLPNPLPIVGDLLAFRYHSLDRFNTHYLTGADETELLQKMLPSFSDSGVMFLVYQDNPQVHPFVDRLRSRMDQLCVRESSELFPSKIRGFTMGVDVYRSCTK